MSRRLVLQSGDITSLGRVCVAHVSLAAVITRKSDPASSQGGSSESTSHMEATADAVVAAVRGSLKEQAERQHQATDEKERQRERTELREEMMEQPSLASASGARVEEPPSLASSSSGARDQVEEQNSDSKRPQFAPQVP